MNLKIKHLLSKDGFYWSIYYIICFVDKFIHVNDKMFLIYGYRCNMGRRLHLKQPLLFSEKLQWLKLYNRDDNYTRYVDKYEVKSWVKEKLGDEYVIPTYGVWDSTEDIDWDSLPNQFVLKCTHDSGGLIICKNKKELNKVSACSVLEKCLKNNYYKAGREWPYKNVPRRVFAEKYMIDEQTGELRDYKFFCFNGVVKFFKIDFDRFIEHRANYYDRNGLYLDFGEVICPRKKDAVIEIPDNLTEMIENAEILSRGIPFVRVDFYNCQGKIYFGEMTFFPAGGMGELDPSDCDEKWGRMLQLPEKKKKA